MVKSVLGVNHQALRDWLMQRVTAVIMAVYTFGLFGFILAHPDTAYYEWHGLFSQLWMKVATIIVLLSLLYHAWIGMWTVYTDYIKVVWLNWVFQIITILALIAFFLETLLILWSV
jgi:succinate dehydrogenase / fumarate reductase membrane anchor subunit